MRFLFTYCIILIACFSGISQITVTSASFPSVGDTLKTATLTNLPNGFSIGNVGGPQTWNFNMLNSGFEQRELCLNPSAGSDVAAFPEANLLISDNGQDQYIKVSDSKMEGLGFGGDNPILSTNIAVKFTKRPVIRQAPLTLNTAINSTSEFNLDLGTDIIPDSLLATLPLKPDSIRIQFSNKLKGKIDAWGTLSLQNKSFSVLRENSEIISDTKLFAKLPFLGWLDVTSVLGSNAPGGLGGFIGKDTMTTYNFYTNTKKEILVSADYNTKNELQSVTFANLGGLISASSQTDNNVRINIYPNPASDYIRMNSTNLKEGRYFITISDMQGKVVVFENAYLKNGDIKEYITNGLSEGSYIFSIRDQFNTSNKSVKFLVR